MVSAVAFIAVFTVIVIIHEFGHFLAAKKAGVKVYEFSIGFPFSPRILTLYRHKETEFTLRLLPLGGFISFAKKGEKGSAGKLLGIPLFKRAVIVSAGSLFNVIFAFLVFTVFFVIVKHMPFTGGVLLSVEILWEISAGTVSYLFGLLSGSNGVEGLAGPVGIASMAGEAANKGFFTLVFFTGLLSMSIGILNLLPLPALDGGHLFMLLIEAVRRKPMGLRTYAVVNVLGLSLFLALTAVVTYMDIVKLTV